MAYAHILDKRKFQRNWFSDKYRSEKEFREAEKARKAAWYQKNKERLIQKVLSARAQDKEKKA